MFLKYWKFGEVISCRSLCATYLSKTDSQVTLKLLFLQLHYQVSCYGVSGYRKCYHPSTYWPIHKQSQYLERGHFPYRYTHLLTTYLLWCPITRACSQRIFLNFFQPACSYYNLLAKKIFNCFPTCSLNASCSNWSDQVNELVISVSYSLLLFIWVFY